MLFLSSLLASQALPPVPPSTTNYANSANWLCLPGRKDVCSTPLRTTTLNPNGYGSTGLSTVAADPGVDCFVVYPTVSSDPGLNSDLVPSDGEERAIVETQFARFSGACRIYAPMYRSMTLGAVAMAAAGGDVTEAGLVAFSDVRAAWKDYLAHRNNGRPFVLLGHSQGSLMLQQLIARDIEGTPAARRMKLAVIPGFNVLVPVGKTAGGTFRSTPICTRAGQTGCVLTWTSYREKNEPPAGAMLGFSEVPGMTVACTNPARPGATGWVPLDSYFFTRSRLPVPGGPVQWSSEGPPPTPYVRTDGLVSARCVNDGPRGYLSIRTNGEPGAKRTGRIGGEVGLMGFFLPGWGMHLADVSVPMGDLIREIGDLNPVRSRTDPLAPR